jgi:hypothetical protein
MGCLSQTDCPEGHKCVGGDCYPIYATFRDWNHTYGTHIYIPDKDFEVMSYADYLKIVGEVENYIKSVPFTPCSLDGQCPEYYESTNTGVCVPIRKTLKEWSKETGIGDMIPSTWEKITYDEFKKSVNEVLSDLKLLKDIRETYCEAESLIDRGRAYQEEFNRKMAKYM